MSTTLDLTICVSGFVFSVSIVRSLSFSLRNANTNLNIDFLKRPSLLISGSGTLPKSRFQKKNNNTELDLWASLI